MTVSARTQSSVGQMLSEARQAQGLNLRDIAQQTRLSLDALEAIEKDDWASLGAPIYARGFVKLYAEAVQVDPRRPLSLMALNSPKTEPTNEPADGRSIEVGTARRAVEIVVEERAVRRPHRIAGALAVMALLFALGWFSFGAGPNVQSESDNDVVLGGSPDGTGQSE